MKTEDTSALINVHPEPGVLQINITPIVDIEPTDDGRFLVVVSLQVDDAPRKVVYVVDCSTETNAINIANKIKECFELC